MDVGWATPTDVEAPRRPSNWPSGPLDLHRGASTSVDDPVEGVVGAPRRGRRGAPMEVDGLPGLGGATGLGEAASYPYWNTGCILHYVFARDVRGSCDKLVAADRRDGGRNGLDTGPQR